LSFSLPRRYVAALDHGWRDIADASLEWLGVQSLYCFAQGLSVGISRRPGVIATDGERKSGEEASEPRASTISFITTEHFTLQGARSATISEATGRAGMFLASVSGGLIAWGLVATATGASGDGTDH
jgi:hypothetical protein